MQKVIKKIFTLILILVLSIQTLGESSISIGAKSIPATNVLLYVGEKFNIEENFTFNDSNGMYFISNPGKYVISNSNVIGIEGFYTKNQVTDNGWEEPEGFCSYIVALHTGTSTVNVLKGSKTIYKYNVTVKNREVAAPTQYFTMTSVFTDDPLERIGRKPNKYDIDLENSTKNILKSLNFESFNTDTERLFTLAKWFNEINNNGVGPFQAVTGNPFDGNDERIANIGEFLLDNMGMVVREVGIDNNYWPEVYLDGTWYRFDASHYTNSSDFSVYAIDHFLADAESAEIITYIKDTKTHLPSMFVNIETKQQNLLVGQSKSLPIDRLSDNTYSSDTSVVDVKDGKLIAKGAGIAIVYRYDDTYCDTFYVVVEPKIKASKKTVTLKKSSMIQKTYKSISPYRKVISHILDIEYIWKETKLFRLEPALKPNGRISTTYNKKTGHLSLYIVDEYGSKKLIFDDKDVPWK